MTATAARSAVRGLGAIRAIAAVAVVTIAASLIALALAQRLIREPQAWLELSRYLPYYWLLAPAVVSLFASVWLRHWWPAVGVLPALALALGPMDLRWNSAPISSATSGRHVRLMTFNAKVGNALAGGGIGAGALAAEVARHDPDIVVLQDANGLLLDRGAPALEGGPPLFGLPHVFALGQYVVASRLPLRGCAPGQIGFGVEQHRYLRCAVDVHGKTLTVVTAHFKSPRDGLSATRHAGLDGAGEWEENFSDRLEQARALARDVATMPLPLVVAGDLNAPDDSPVVQALLAAGLADSFSTSGRGFGFTYGHSMRAGLSFLRIDHILASRDVTVVDSYVGEGRASEHRPVIADLILGDSPNQGELL